MPVTAIAEPRNADLDAAIAANPDDLEAYRVYADWLEGHGHPRALLIRAQLAEKDARSPGKAVRKLFHDHRAALLGPLSRFESALAWRFGFVWRARLSGANGPIVDHVATLLAHPAARFLATLGVSAPDATPLVPLLAAHAPATLRELSFATETAPVVARDLPIADLRTLSLHGRVTLDEPIVAPELLHLACYGPCPTFAGCELPRLVRLAIDRPDLALAPLFAQALPALVDLELRRAADIDQLCELLVAAPFAPQLGRLEIGDGLTTRGVRALVGSGRLGSLTALDVKTNAALTDDDLEDLRGLGIDVEDGRYDDIDE